MPGDEGATLTASLANRRVENDSKEAGPSMSPRVGGDITKKRGGQSISPGFKKGQREVNDRVSRNKIESGRWGG